MASLQTPILHRDISIGSIIHHGDAYQACLIDFGTAVHAPTGSFTAATSHSIPATSTFMARSVLEGGAYTLSLELESLMYVIVFLAIGGQAHWGKKSVVFKVQSLQ